MTIFSFHIFHNFIKYESFNFDLFMLLFLKVHGLLRRFNLEAKVIETTQSQVDIKQIVNAKSFSLRTAEKNQQWLKEARSGDHKPETLEYICKMNPAKLRIFNFSDFNNK